MKSTTISLLFTLVFFLPSVGYSFDLRETKRITTIESRLKNIENRLNRLERKLANSASTKTAGNSRSARANSAKTNISLENRLSKLESVVRITPAGLSIKTPGNITLETSALVSIKAVNIKMKAGMVTASGVLKAATVISDSVVSSSYTPGAGNIW